MNPMLQVVPPAHVTPEPQSVADAISALHNACAGWHTPEPLTTGAYLCAEAGGHNVPSFIWVAGIIFSLVAVYFFVKLVRFSVCKTDTAWGDKVVYGFCGLLGGLYAVAVVLGFMWPFEAAVDWRLPLLAGALLFVVIRYLHQWRERRLIRLLTTNPEGAEHA